MDTCSKIGLSNSLGNDVKKKHKGRKAKKIYDFKTSSTHPHICANCGGTLKKCGCSRSYVFAYKCKGCGGMKSIDPTDLEQIEENIDLGIIKSVLSKP